MKLCVCLHDEREDHLFIKEGNAKAQEFGFVKNHGYSAQMLIARAPASSYLHLQLKCRTLIASILNIS